jgi:hypothetical protein
MSYITTQFSKTFKRSTKPSLTETLVTKADELNQQVDTHLAFADHLTKEAASETSQARTKLSHAKAVEKAYVILDSAGVKL